MPHYKCIRKCYHRGQMYFVGDPFTPLPGEKIPHHFKEVMNEEELVPPELNLQDLTKKELMKYAEDLKIDLQALEITEKSKKAEMIGVIKAKLRDAKLNLPSKTDLE